MAFERQAITELTIHPDVLSEIIRRVGSLFPSDHSEDGFAFFRPDYLVDTVRDAALVTISNNHPAHEGPSVGYLLRWGSDFIYVAQLSLQPYRTYRITKASMGARSRRLEFQQLFDEALSGENPTSHAVFV